MPKILAIDNNYFFLEVLVELLEYKGFTVITALNGQLGLQLAATQSPDLITCGIGMPGMDGYQLLKLLRQNSITQQIPVIFLTGAEMDQACRQARNLGANNCLDKLCSIQELIDAIKAQLKGNVTEITSRSAPQPPILGEPEFKIPQFGGI